MSTAARSRVRTCQCASLHVLLLLLTSLALTGVAAAGAPTVVRELPEERTQYSTTYLLSNGTFRAVLVQEPVNFKDASGAWQPIDASLVPVAGLDVYATVAAPVEVTLADEAPGQKPVTVASGEYVVTMNLLGWAEDEKLILGDSAIYSGVAPDTDVTYTATGDGLKEVITLMSPIAPGMFSYRLSHPGLSLRRAAATGEWGLYAGDAAEPTFVLGAMNASDSSRDEADEPAWCDGASMSVSPGEGASTITYSLPRAWLADPARVWPVKIDPQLFTRNPDDTYVSLGYPNTAYGSSQELLCGKVSTATDNCRALVKFPQVDSSIPDDVEITGATFQVRQFWQPATNNDHTYISRCASAWSNASTWTSLNPLSTVALGEYDVAGSAWLMVDATSVVQGWKDGLYANNGFVLKQTTDEGAAYARKFRSGEYSDAAYRPQITVDYVCSAPRHASYGLPEFAEHSFSATLDRRSLEAGISDLAIATWGPPAVLSRSYSSTRTSAGLFAPGWRFGFERGLRSKAGGAPLTSDTFVYYYDEAGEAYVFTSAGAGGWTSPLGYFGTLTCPGGAWTLTPFGGSTSAFNSSGNLVSETDRNGNAVAYTWSGATMTKIKAANGYEIVLTYTGGKLSSASYSGDTVARQVGYTVVAPWRVIQYPGQTGLEHTVEYTYTASLLTTLKALSFTAAGDASEQFLYAGSDLSEVRFPDYAANSDARAGFAYIGGSAPQATVTRYGAVRTGSTPPTGSAGTAVTELYTWNGDGTMATKTNPSSSGTYATWSYAYNAANQVTGEAPPLGAAKSWSYDARGNLLSATDEAGHATTYAYPASDSDPNRDLPLSISGPVSGALTTYEYDACGNKTREQKKLTSSAWSDASWSYSELPYGPYRIRGALTQEKRLVIGSSWAVTDFTDFYYRNGRPGRTIDRAVALYDPSVVPSPAPTSPVDLTETRTYNGYGELLTRTDAAGTTLATNVYDLGGRRLTSSDRAGVVSRASYDAFGHETATWTTHPSLLDNNAPQAQVMFDRVEKSYDVCGRLTTETSKLMNDAKTAYATQSTVTHTYDGLGREISVSDSTVVRSDRLAARTAYDAAGNALASWELGVAATSYTDAFATICIYDALGRETSRTEPGDDAATTTSHTATGLVSVETRADGSTATHAYDWAGSETSLADTAEGSQSSTTSSYDLGGRLASQTETTASGSLMTSFTYDLLDRQVAVVAGAQQASTITYNTLGWTLKAVDVDGIVTTTVYDVAGRATQETTAGNTSRSEYDATTGRLTRQIDPNDRWVVSEYDALGRVTRETHTTAGSPRVTVRDTTTTYDSIGRAKTSTDNTTTITHGWIYPDNTAGDATETLTVGAGGSTKAVTTITCDGSGREASRSTAIDATPPLPTLGRTVDTRDEADQATKATATGALAATAQWGYDADGRLARQWGTTGGGSGYTAAAQMTTAYIYNATTGLKISDDLRLATVGGAGAITAAYGYSASDGRLTSATIDGTLSTYTFDALGNITSATDGGLATSFTYAGNRLTSSTKSGVTTAYGWDTTQGWRTSQGPQGQSPAPIAFSYTGTGRLAGYADAAVTPNVSATYAYDAAGQRTKSVVTRGVVTTTTEWTYEGLTLLSLKATESGGTSPTSWRITYLYDENDVPYAGVYRSPADSTTPIVFGLLTSDRGDIVALLDATGNPFAAYRYDAWGNQRDFDPSPSVYRPYESVSTGLIDATTAARIAERQVLRYASYCFDAESGLFYLSARHYDPATRQFVSKDPAEADGEESAYQYCAGDPVGEFDFAGAGSKKIIFPKYARKMKDWTGYYNLVLAVNAAYAQQTMMDKIVENPVLGVARTWKWWVWDMVRGGHPWDLKLAAPKNRTKKYIPYRGKLVSPEDIGNIHFGYTGTAIGLPMPVLIEGSLAASLTHIPAGWYDAAISNEFKDHKMIRWGGRLFFKIGCIWPSVAFRKRHDSCSQRLAGVGPGEGLGALGRVGTDVVHDLRDELGLRVPHRVLEHVAGEDAEPDLDLVQPGGVGGREVQGQPPPLGRPGEYVPVLVHGEVVEDDVQLGARVGAVEGLQEAQEGLVVVALHAAPRDLSRVHREGRQQAGGAVALVGGRQAPVGAGAHRQLGLGAVERLDLALLIDADDEGVRRRVEVEAEDRRLLLLELGVGAAPAPVLRAVRPQSALAQDAVHRGGAEAAGGGEAADAPAARAVRGLGGRKRDHGEAFLGADLQGPAGARPVEQAVEPLLEVAPPPGGDGLGGKAGGGADRRHRLAGGGEQHDLRALPEAMLAPARRGPGAQRRLVGAPQLDTESLALGHGAPPARGWYAHHIMILGERDTSDSGIDYFHR